MQYLTLLVIFPAFVWGFQPSTIPPYCTDDIATRDIPALTTDEQNLVSSLIQVQPVIRHGARTPYSYHTCWDGYDISWNDCNVTGLMLASDSYTSQTKSTDSLFRVLYDASPNSLGGNCQTGQLIGQGYSQESGLGLVLKQAYIGAGNLKLFPSNQWNSINQSRVYFRSDDETRTKMSGQLLVTNMFDTTGLDLLIPWHTGEYQLDQLHPNSGVCPRMNEVGDAAYASNAYVSELASSLVQSMDADLDTILGAGYWDWDTVMDCFETTVCTGRDIPDGTAETPMTDSLFNSTIAQAEYIWSYRALYNNSWWSKLAMGQTVYYIRERMNAAMTANSANPPTEDSFQFVLYSAHDTTVMPLLAALFGEQWDGLWAGYASLMSFELYNSSSVADDYYFRIVYNGKALVFPGCSTSLCDVQTFMDATTWAQESMPCATEDTTSTTTSSDSNNFTMSTGGWIGLCVMSAVLGGVAMYCVMMFMNAKPVRTPTNNDDDDKLRLTQNQL